MKFAGAFLGILFLGSRAAAYGLAFLLAISGGIFAFVLVSLLPNTNEDRFEPLGHRRVPKKNRKRRPRPVEDDSYREKFQPRKEKLDELEVIDEDYEVEILEEEEEKQRQPKKTPPRPPQRKPAADADPSHVKPPERKPSLRPPMRKPNPNRDGFRPPER